MRRINNHGYTMTICDYLGIYIDHTGYWGTDSDEQFDCIFEVFNFRTDSTEIVGTLQEVNSKYWSRDCEVQSLDIPKVDEETGKILMCININEDWSEWEREE